MTGGASTAHRSEETTRIASAGSLPSIDAWRAAAAAHEHLFAPLDPGARIGLIDRGSPSLMLVWDVDDRAVDARVESFTGYAASAADIVLASDAESLARIRATRAEALFTELRAGIRSGHVVCYVLKRRCELEERGFDELLEALGFAFMGACR